MNWTIFFAIIILMSLFARPIWWIICLIIRFIYKVINYFIQLKKNQGGDKFDVFSNK